MYTVVVVLASGVEGGCTGVEICPSPTGLREMLRYKEIRTTQEIHMVGLQLLYKGRATELKGTQKKGACLIWLKCECHLHTKFEQEFWMGTGHEHEAEYSFHQLGFS
jgi:hypothetical protein